MATPTRMRRLLSPRSIAVIGGQAADLAIRNCRDIGFDGPIWPVHPQRSRLGGLESFSSIGDLPHTPDAALIAVPAAATIDLVGDLARMGTGGAVCFASGFAETGSSGKLAQQQLVAAAGEMPLIGPNCLGIINYLDRVALWPDEHGGKVVERGVAIISQSGNIGQNLSMHRRSLPISHLITIGNSAVTGVSAVGQELLDDERVTAIGVYLEGLDDIPAFIDFARAALDKRVPVIVLKSGSSHLGALANLSHTSALTSTDALVDALFGRLGVGRVGDVPSFIETLKFMHTHGASAGRSIASASCSGGEAALVADLADAYGVDMPAFPDSVQEELESVLGERVYVTNPLDYHTYIWGDEAAQTRTFRAFLDAPVDAHLLVVDRPRSDRADPAQWDKTINAFTSAVTSAAGHPGPTAIVSLVPESLPEDVGYRLLAAGIAPMQGIREAISAIHTSSRIAAAQNEEPLPSVELHGVELLGVELHGRPGEGSLIDEHTGKTRLAGAGVSVPKGELVGTVEEAVGAALRIGFPVVAKAVLPPIAHKTDTAAVRTNLQDAEQVSNAVTDMRAYAHGILIERMVHGTIAELIVGAHRDEHFGLTLTIGFGGVLVELLRDVTTLLFPITRENVDSGLRSLQLWPVLEGARGSRRADVPAAVDAICAIAEFVRANSDSIAELEVNPLLVGERGAVAADVLIRSRSA